jgi:hypothetical protein
MYAARDNMPKTMKVLLDNKADISLKSDLGERTALWEAALTRNSEKNITLLLEAGASPEKELLGIKTHIFSAAHISSLKDIMRKHKQKHPELPENFGDFVNHLISHEEYDKRAKENEEKEWQEQEQAYEDYEDMMEGTYTLKLVTKWLCARVFKK